MLQEVLVPQLHQHDAHNFSAAFAAIIGLVTHDGDNNASVDALTFNVGTGTVLNVTLFLVGRNDTTLNVSGLVTLSRRGRM